MTQQFSAERSGGAGTIYLKKSGDEPPTLVVENGGTETIGWSTPLSDYANAQIGDLTIAQAARLDARTPGSIRRLLGGSFAQLQLPANFSIGSISVEPTNVFSIIGSFGYESIFLSNKSTLFLAGSHKGDRIDLTNGAAIFAMPLFSLALAASDSIRVASDSLISADQAGYPGRRFSSPAGSGGPGEGDNAFITSGPGQPGGGGSYGGIGASNAVNGDFMSRVYGSVFAPGDFGSGAGASRWGPGEYFGGFGGGSIYISSPQLFLDGNISANANGGATVSGGSGGSILLKILKLHGKGKIQANGGDGAEASGGGGRIAIYYADKSEFLGAMEARGGVGRNPITSGGAGTVYLQRGGETGELIINNQGTETVGWTTPLSLAETLHLKSLNISGGARVRSLAGIHVASGDPAYFGELIEGGLLEFGGLIVSNTWVYGDVMDLEIRRQEAGSSGQGTGAGSQEMALVTVYCRPERTYLLLASTNFLDWIPVATNTPTGSRFDYVDTLGIPFSGSPVLPQRFFRAVMLEHLYDGLGISMEGTGTAAAAPYRTRVAVSNAQPGHTLILQASPDLHRWTSLSTNTPAAVTNWQYLDTNAPAFNQRFYRAIGQGK